MHKDSFVFRYGFAVVALLVALAARLALQPWLGTNFPHATVFTAIAFVVWTAGTGPAIVTLAVGWVSAGILFRGGLSVMDLRAVEETAAILLYLIAGVPTILLGQATRTTSLRLKAREQQLSTTNVALENQVEAQSLIAAIVASSEDAIISQTLDGIITSWNLGAERLFGWRASEAIGRSIQLIIPPEYRDQERGFLEQLRRGERIERQDLHRLRKNGAKIHVSMTVSPVYDHQGHIFGASTTARDITERKAWEDRLMHSAEAQRLLVGIHDATRGEPDPANVMREIVTRVGMHFDVIRCAYGEVHADDNELLISRGYTRNVPTVAGRYPLNMFGDRLVDALKAGRTAAIDDVRTAELTDSPVAREQFALMHIVSMVCVPLLRAGKLVAIMVMADDKVRTWSDADAHLLEQVAERTVFAVESARAATALREYRDVLQLAMTTARMGAWSRDLTRGTLWWSPEFAELVGFGRDDTNYSRERMFALIGDDDRTRLPAIIEAAINNRTDYAIEYQLRHARTGELRWMEAHGRAVYGADGRPTMLHGLVADITERRRAVDALKDADRRKDEFLAMLAHELRNPLAPISAGLHILRKAPSGPEAAAALDIMHRQVGQMVRLVDDLLDVARITTGKVEIRQDALDVMAAVNDALETTQPLVGRKRIRVVTPDDALYVSADRTRLAQVFANLVNNAAKYSEQDQPILVTVRREGDDAVVRVRDHGIGIEPDMLPRVFEMFRQVERSGGWTRGGLGIGLSLVKRIVELHGGTVSAHSEGAGHGSEFVVRLPLGDGPSPVAQVVAATPAPACDGSRRVLVVDDNADAAESLSTLLALSGHETRVAHDGYRAIEQAEVFQPDVIFLDIGMPGMDGHETARRIREHAWGRDMVLVALTGWGQNEDRRRSKDAGFDVHLVKPADPSEVTAVLSSLG